MAVDVKTFATLLAKELAARGIPREIAVKHAVSLVRTFDEEDLREISQYTFPNEFEDLTDSLAELIRDKNVIKTLPAERPVSDSEVPRETPENTEAVSAATGTFVIPKRDEEPEVPMGATREIPVQGASRSGDGLEHMKTKAYDMEVLGIPSVHTQAYTGLRTSDITIKTDTASEITMINLPVSDSYDDKTEIYVADDDEDYSDEEEKVTLTKRGKGFFWGIAVATSPFTLVIALLVLCVFAIGIVAVCAFIGVALVTVCAEAVAGSGLALVGIIYGAIEIVSDNMATGIYEIGLGICCGGLALCLGILTYNFAVVVLPYFLRQLIAFEGYCLKRVGPMLNRFREECNRL